MSTTTLERQARTHLDRVMGQMDATELRGRLIRSSRSGLPARLARKG